MAKTTGLDIWLQTGRKVNIRGKELILMPLPLKHLKSALESIESVTRDFARDFVVKADRGELDFMSIARDVLNSFNSTEVAYSVFMLAKDPDTGESLNRDLTKEWLDENLDLPTMRRLIAEFVEVNEIEDALKKARDLPMLKGVVDALMMTYGIALLKSSQPITDSTPGKSLTSPSLSSTDTANPDTGETQENGTRSPMETMNTEDRPRVG